VIAAVMRFHSGAGEGIQESFGVANHVECDAHLARENAYIMRRIIWWFRFQDRRAVKRRLGI